MFIRIGNDIRLNLTLRGGYQEYNQANIKQIRAYLINTSLKKFNTPECCEECRRFPNHQPPFMHQVTPDCIGVCGRPGYHAKPWHHPKHHFHPKPWYPYIPVNPAFGEGPLPPNYGHGECCECFCPNMFCDNDWHHDYHHDCHHDFHHDHCWDHHCDIHPINPSFAYNECEYKYLAPSNVLPEKNRIQVYFPATAQYFCGTYKLVIVLVTYEAGWGACNLHHYTVDYGNVFTLVDDETGIDGDLTVDVDNGSLEKNGVTSITMGSDRYRMYTNTSMTLGSVDVDGHVYTMDFSIENGGTLRYNPNNWPYDRPKFSTNNPAVLRVDNNGTLISYYTSDDVNVEVTVRVGTVTKKFIVLVQGTIKDYIGFSEVGPDGYNDLKWESFERYADPKQYRPIGVNNLNIASLTAVDDIFTTHTLNNTVDGQFLWICSREPIESAGNGEYKMPLVGPVQKENWYCYCCPNPVVKWNNIKITVNK